MICCFFKPTLLSFMKKEKKGRKEERDKERDRKRVGGKEGVEYLKHPS